MKFSINEYKIMTIFFQKKLFFLIKYEFNMNFLAQKTKKIHI